MANRNRGGRHPKATPDDALAQLKGRADRAEPVTASELAEELAVSRRTALNKLHELEERDAVASKKVGGRARVWWLPLRDERPPDSSAAAVLREWEPEGEVNAERAHAAAERAVEWLRQSGERRTRSEFVAALAAEEELGERVWWDRAVRPALGELADAGYVEYREGHHDYRWLG